MMGRKLIFFSFLFSFNCFGLEEYYFKAKKMKVPRRDISIIITDEGYYPKSLSAFRGEEVRFFITSTVSKPSCFMIGEKNVFIGINKGEVNEVQTKFNEVGQFNFYCPTGNIKGQINVLERPEVTRRKLFRRPASVKTVWRPRDDVY